MEFETGIKEQIHSVDTDPKKVHKLDYSANEQSKTIKTSYYIGDVQTQLTPKEGVSLRGWNDLEMDILDIPIWQLMGSKEVKNTNGIYISKPKISDYGYCKLKGFEIIFKDVSLSCINTEATQNSYQTIHDPIIEIRKRARGINSQYIENDWQGITSFYDEDYGDSIKINNGAGSMSFKLGGHYIRTPKNILHNVNLWSDPTKYTPMRLGDLLFPIILEYNQKKNISDLYSYTTNTTKLTRMQYDVNPPITYPAEAYYNITPTKATNDDIYESEEGSLSIGTQHMMRMGQWPEDVIDYSLEIRVRNLPQINNATAKVVWNLTYGIEIKSTWECMSFEPSIYQDSALLIPIETIKFLRSNKQFGWLNKVVKILANAFIDWLVPTNKENNNKNKKQNKLLELENKLNKINTNN